MSLDSHSLERLKQLGRQLPKEITKLSKSESTNIQSKSTKKYHPVETETNPEKLFHELINVSSDGNVPVHLLDRLKKAEAKLTKGDPNIDFDNNEESDNFPPHTNLNNENKDKLNTQEESLYTSFKQLLLEDDI